MIVLTVNAGSTSVKLGAHARDATGTLERIAAEAYGGAQIEPQRTLAHFGATLAPQMPAVVAHRIVHGGTHFTRPARLDGTAEAKIAALAELAPLHNPLALRWLAAARRAWPAALHVGVFDTAWFAHMPRVASEYAVPAEIGPAHGVRRYGFHGLAHEAMWRRWCELRPDLERGGRLITLQLGGGCSITASAGGRALDTSMGFSPLEGLVMATRAGDLDPAVLPYLERRRGIGATQALEILNRRSGLLGLSGRSASAGELVAAGGPEAQFAIEMYCYRARKYIGAFVAVLGGVDGIVFGGGVGEHVPEVRDRILRGLDVLGIELDAAANSAARGGEARLEAPASRVGLHALAVDEDSLLAQAAASAAAPG